MYLLVPVVAASSIVALSHRVSFSDSAGHVYFEKSKTSVVRVLQLDLN